ncbi:MAG: hypothetical protein ACTS44_00465 [Candidatus Hodgkinia cicadicola]
MISLIVLMISHQLRNQSSPPLSGEESDQSAEADHSAGKLVKMYISRATYNHVNAPDCKLLCNPPAGLVSLPKDIRIISKHLPKSPLIALAPGNLSTTAA